MDSRPLLKKEEKLGIFIDSISLDKLLAKSNENAKTVLIYNDSDFFEFIRSPLGTDKEELKQIVSYKKEEENNQLKGIEITRDKSTSNIYFGYKMEDIEDIAKGLYEKKEVSEAEKQNILLAFIQAVFNSFDNKNILVTEDKILLKNRLWFESHFPGAALNIVTVDESMELMNLFLKFRKQYCISSRYKCNKGLWYWHLFRLKVPFYNVGESILTALANRFVYVLMAVDEIGMQYFLGVNNDTMDNTVYHFNYLISLTSGIFDSLAIKSRDQYNLKFDRDDIPSRTSLYKKAGKDFLNALREKNQTLRNHISDNANFINLIYQLRDLTIHREMHQKTSFDFRDNNERWKANFVKISEVEIEQLKHLNDKAKPYDPISEWGVYKLGDDYFLEPYNFSKTATKKLINFVNKYLELLGFDNFFEKRKKEKPDDELLKTSERFGKTALSFLF